MADPQAAPPAPSAADLPIEEMLRIMDVATTLRRERERASVELDLDETRRLLRTRLLETAAATGERVTEAEVDAAIEHYYRSLHAFEPPPRGWRTFVAHVYIRRVRIAVFFAIVAALTALIWWLFYSANAMFSEEGQTLRRAYEIRIANPSAGGRSAFELSFEDEAGQRVNGYYVIVEARDPSGDLVECRVRDAKSGREQDVSRWAELVPKAVYDRLKRDKVADGILDETRFATKRAGELEQVILLTGVDGTPIPRGRQLVSWPR